MLFRSILASQTIADGANEVVFTLTKADIANIDKDKLSSLTIDGLVMVPNNDEKNYGDVYVTVSGTDITSQQLKVGTRADYGFNLTAMTEAPTIFAGRSLIMIIVTTALVNNVVLSQFLGICSFLGVSSQKKASLSLGLAVTAVLTVSSAVASLLYDHVLLPLGLDYLKTIVFILVIAALVQMVEMFLKKNAHAVYQALGIYLPLITTNCAVLGVALTNVQNGYNLIQSIFAGFGTAVGYTVAIVLLAAVREHLDEDAIPAPFRGAPIVLLCAALMAMAFVGFSGLA